MQTATPPRPPPDEHPSNRAAAWLDRVMPIAWVRLAVDRAAQSFVGLLLWAVFSPDASAAMQAATDALAWQSGLAVGLCAGVLGGLVIGAGLGLFLWREPKP